MSLVTETAERTPDRPGHAADTGGAGLHRRPGEAFGHQGGPEMSTLGCVFLRVLGTLVVETGKPPGLVPVPGAKERALLGRLLTAPGRVVPVNVLIDDLWDGTPPPTARKSLQAHVVRARTALEPQRPKGSPGQYLVRRGDGYVLAVGPEAVDATAAVSQAAAGRAAAAAGDLSSAREHLATALGYWRGEPFEDWRDAPWAQGERRRLADVRATIIEARVDVDLALGQHRDVVAELEALVAAEPLREGWWTRLMLAQYRSDRQADALAAGRRARAILADAQGVDPGPGLARMEELILTHSDDLLLRPARAQPPTMTAGPATATMTAVSAVCPYRGLAVYEAGDAPLFHGRGAAVRALIARMVRARLVVVSGPSGAGKSSLVRAGLLPMLAAGAVPDARGATTMVIKPGAHPVDQLAPLLDAPDGGPSGAGDPDDAGVVLVVDQFEELWTAGAGAAERAAFADTVLALLGDGVLARLVLVVRGDHLGRLAEHADLAGRTGDGLVLVPPLTEPELREVVQGPAHVAGLDVDPDLVDAVVRDVSGQAAALPLLSTALVGTWERRRGRVLTLAGYVEAGGVTGALAGTAETVFTGLDSQEQALARRLLVRLAAPGGFGDSGALVRRRVALSELGLDESDGPGRRAVVEAFVARRLLTIDSDHVEVTHEALLTGWPRLAGWLAEDSLGRAVRTHLAPEARAWQADGRPADRLYRGARLDAALDWLSRPDADPTAVEQAFLRASADRAQADLAAAQEQTQRERAARRRTRRLAAVLAVTTLAAALGGLFAVQGRQAAVANAQRAQADALRADADRLAAAAANAPAPDLSLLLAAQAYRLESTPQTEDALLAATVDHRKIIGVFRADGVARRLAVSPDGRTLYAHTDTQVIAWDVLTHRARTLVHYQTPEAIPKDVAASPARTGPGAGLVAVVTPRIPGSTTSSTLTLVDSDGRARWTRAASALGGWPMTAQFTADGRRLGVVVIDGFGSGAEHRKVVFVATDTGRATPTGIQEALPPGQDGNIWYLGLAQDATKVITGMSPSVHDLSRRTSTQLIPPGIPWIDLSQVPVVGGNLVTTADGTTYWYPAGSARSVERIADHTSAVTDAATDAAGRVLVTVAPDLRVVVSDLVGGQWQRREVLTGHGGNILAVAVSRDGSRAFTAGDDGTVIVWDLTDSQGFGKVIPTPTFPDAAHHLLPGRSLLVIGDPVLAPGGGRSASWVVPMMVFGSVRSQGPVYAAFVEPTRLRTLAGVQASARPAAGYPVETVTVSPDGKLIALTTMYSTAIVDPVSHGVIHQITLPTVPSAVANTGDVATGVPEPASATAWSADGKRLFIATQGARGVGPRGAVVVVDTATWRPITRVLPPGDANCLTVSPDGRALAIGLSDGSVDVADSSTYRVLHRWRTGGAVNALAFSADGTRLAAVGTGRRLDVWDVRTGEPVLAKAPSFAGAGVSVRWLPRSHTLVYGGDDGQAVIFDTDSATQRGVPLPVYQDSGVGNVNIAPVVGGQLALFPGWRSFGQTRQGVEYPLNPSDWLAYACAVVQRDLTTTEWATYLPGRPHRLTCTDLIH